MKSAKAFLIGLATSLLFVSCTTAHPPDGSAQRYAAVMSRYPQGENTLRVPRLSSGSFHALPAGSRRGEVIIMVHPGYSFFFTLGKKVRYRGAKYRLMEHQFEAEARFLAAQAAEGRVVILIVPGKYETDSTNPLAYTSYLNSAAGPAVFHLPSETSSNGTISTSDVVTLFHFLQAIRARRVLIGGGYIGRCQREFYKQLTSYFDTEQTFLLREASSISPQDVTPDEAELILNRLQQRDFNPVVRFMTKKLGRNVNFMTIPSAAP